MNAVCFMTTANEKGGEKIPKSPTFSTEILKGGGYFNLNWEHLAPLVTKECEL